MNQGLKPLAGLAYGLNPGTVASGGPDTDAASWKVGFEGFSSPNATDEWLMQDATSPAANNVGSETLVNDDGTVGATNAKAHDGYDYGNRLCYKSTLATNSYAASSNVAGDASNADFCIRMVFNQVMAGVSGRYFAAKRASGAAAGWELTQASTRLAIEIGDGTTNASIATDSTTLGDGALHYVTAWFDDSADMLFIKADNGAEASVDTSGVVGDISNTAKLIVNSYREAGSNGIIGCEYSYFGVCVGANSQTMYNEDFWQHVEP